MSEIARGLPSLPARVIPEPTPAPERKPWTVKVEPNDKVVLIQINPDGTGLVRSQCIGSDPNVGDTDEELATFLRNMADDLYPLS